MTSVRDQALETVARYFSRDAPPAERDYFEAQIIVDKLDAAGLLLKYAGRLVRRTHYAPRWFGCIARVRETDETFFHAPSGGMIRVENKKPKSRFVLSRSGYWREDLVNEYVPLPGEGDPRAGQGPDCLADCGDNGMFCCGRDGPERGEESIEALTEALREAQNHVEFMHGCLTAPETFTYAHPEMAQNALRRWAILAPRRPPCIHSWHQPGCLACEARLGVVAGREQAPSLSRVRMEAYQLGEAAGREQASREQEDA